MDEKDLSHVEALLNDCTSVLSDECYQMARYLVGQASSSLSPRSVQLYIEAHAALFTKTYPPMDIRIVVFVRRYPWSLPYLDATLSILRPHALLRNKIFLMIAILETTPCFTECFFPKPLSIPQFLWHMVRYGMISGAKFLLGCVIYLFAVNAK